MEAKGRLTNISLNVDTGRTCLTFEMDSLRPDSIEDIRECPLRIKAAKWREKRSLTANAYFHVLVAKIAQVLRISDTMAKNMLIARYGQLEIVNDAPVAVPLRSDIDSRELEAMHLQPTAKTVIMNGKPYTWHLVMRGSHTYDTAEMSRLIDGTVSEAKELGIDTMPPDELERMVQRWKREA